jgi:hypothetical protein
MNTNKENEKPLNTSIDQEQEGSPARETSIQRQKDKDLDEQVKKGEDEKQDGEKESRH